MTYDSVKLFDVERQGDTLIVTPQCDASECRYLNVRAAWKTLLRRLDEPGIVNLVIDFGDVALVGSETLGLVPVLARNVQDIGGQSVLCNVSDELQTALNALSFGDLWRQVPSRQEALQSLRQS